MQNPLRKRTGVSVPGHNELRGICHGQVLRHSAASRRLQVTHWADRYKPAAARHTQLLLAWLMWATVGSALVGFGAWWLWDSAPAAAPWVGAAAIAVGVVKSKLVLDRAAGGWSTGLWRVEMAGASADSSRSAAGDWWF